MAKTSVPKILEKHIQKACEDLLQLDGWRIFRVEQQWSDKKRKSVGEEHAADALCIRYCKDRELAFDLINLYMPFAEVVFIEWKRTGGKATVGQKIWHLYERIRGAVTWIAGEDFEPTVDGFITHYRASGLNRGRV